MRQPTRNTDATSWHRAQSNAARAARLANPRRANPRAADRRGVLLLVVLSLLVLFSMITVTFVLVAGQYRRMSRAAGKVELVGDNPSRQLDEVFAQIVRDTPTPPLGGTNPTPTSSQSPSSSVHSHSLLHDLYGNDGVMPPYGTTNPSIPPPPLDVTAVGTSNQFIDLRFDEMPPTPATAVIQGMRSAQNISTAQIHTAGFYNGCVLTALNGAAADKSTRIVGWGYDGTSAYTIRIMAFDGVSFAELTAPGGAPSGVLINGRPFNGTGFGFDPTADPNTAPSLLSMPDASGSFQAYLNNARYFPRPGPGGYPEFGGWGGADEDYDAPDLQNMLLAYLPIKDPTNPIPYPITSDQILPSLHRPDLIRYMATLATSNWTTLPAAQLRRAMLRPIGQGHSAPDHPFFTGSNPLFDAVNGPWDVDNDGDGIAESVWIDVGLPVTTAPDGRRYKPLAAILCVDLDGRLNVNAHGTYAQSDNRYDTNPPTQIQPGGTTPNIADYVWTSLATQPDVTLPRGLGFGPAEVDLARLFTSPKNYELFLRGWETNNNRVFVGRYGEWIGPVAGALPGRTFIDRMTQQQNPPGPDDRLAMLTRFSVPAGYNYYTGPRSDYGSPPDLSGQAVVGIDYAGQPIWSFHRTPPPGGTVASDQLGWADNQFRNDPYVLNLSRGRVREAGAPDTGGDNPFSPGELERVLRPYDIDAEGLPDRLKFLLEETADTSLDLARMVTTDSFDLPTPAVLPTRSMRDLLNREVASNGDLPRTRGLTIADILRAHLLTQLAPVGSPLTTMQVQDANMRIVGKSTATPDDRLLPADVLSGKPFDLNRPFGNGIDDNTNEIVDEPGEYTSVYDESPVWTNQFGYATQMDLNNDGQTLAVATAPTSDLYARQQYARYLYNMMMLFAELEFNLSPDANNAARRRELTARRIAQWAINVVDFRDSDAIMTPFEYDVRPFDDQTIDWQLGTGDDTNAQRRIVWGCERPELLISETLALHDKRLVDDVVIGQNDVNGTNMANPIDDEMDQERIPEGSLFVELYCPRNVKSVSDPNFPRELYDANGLLDLGRMAPAGPNGAYPVWQIAITESRNSNAGNFISNLVSTEPDITHFDPVPGGISTDFLHGSVFDTQGTNGAAQLERFVWFSDQAPTGSNPDQGRIYYNAAGTSTLLAPGGFAVVGPRVTTFVGLTTGGTAPSQSFIVDPSGPTVGFTQANANAPNNATTPNASTPGTPLPIICRSAIPPTGWTRDVGVSVSEPVFSVNYYPMPSLPGPLPPVGTVIDRYAPADYGGTDSADIPFDTANNRPLGQHGVLATGMHLDYKTALLQRLANPLEPYDAVLNPYITVDWQAIDLNVFNGEELAPSPSPDPQDPDWPNPPPNSLPVTGPPDVLGVGSRERGATPAGTPSNLWGNHPQQPTNVPTILKGPNAVFDYNFNNSLGYLNKSMGTPWVAGGAQAPYSGLPQPSTTPKPFSWITWNNRPYANKMELLLVPSTSAEELLRRHTTNTGSNPYDAASAELAFRAPFSHLFNFFLSANGTANAAPYLYRILDFVDVPSRFVGTETLLPPQPFTGPLPSNNTSALTEDELASYYHPPFNRVSHYRDPGRVNINTIAGPPGASAAANNPVWDALLNGAVSPTWQELVASRRGDGPPANSNVTTPDFSKPSVFANPFRTAGGAAFKVPIQGAAVENEVNATILRPHPTSADRPLFQPDIAAIDPTVLPFTHPDEHPYFRYQNFIRLSNSLTTRSNVYAIWITVGYFEVTPWDPDNNNVVDYDAAHPDGWQLGQEMGSDTGSIERHRAFYIYDRTIPVGFEPGQDHNIEDGVLVRRFIE